MPKKGSNSTIKVTRPPAVQKRGGLGKVKESKVKPKGIKIR